MKKSALVVVDYGTSNVRASILDAETGEVKYQHSQSSRILSPKPGYLELSVDDLWANCQKCVKEVFDLLAKDDTYHADVISFSYFGDNLILADANDDPVHNLILCFDPRGSAEAMVMNDHFGNARLISTIGGAFSSGAIPAKIQWVRSNLPDVYKKAKHVMTNQQYTMKKLGFSRVSDLSMAGRMMALDIDSGTWDTEIIDYLGFSASAFGEIAPASAVIGEIDSFGGVKLPYKIPVTLGAHDCSCGLLGTGITSDMGDTIGNVAGTFDHYGYTDFTGTLKGSRSSGCLPGLIVKMSAVSNSGSLILWFMNTIHGSNEQDAYARFWKGSRLDGSNPINVNPRFFANQGSISGLDLSVTQQDMFDAFIESVTFAAKGVLDRVRADRGQTVNKIRIGGGPSKSEDWNRHKSNVFGMRLERLKTREVSSTGAGAIGAYGIGRFSSIEDAMRAYAVVDDVYEPDMELHGIYNAKYETYMKRV